MEQSKTKGVVVMTGKEKILDRIREDGEAAVKAINEESVAAVKEVIVDNIRIGRGTELGPLGCVELSVKADAVDSVEELNKKLIEKTKIIYKPSKDIKKALKKVKYKIEK